MLHGWFVGATGFPVPNAVIGAFDILAWQLLWVLGLWIGATYAQTQCAPAFPGWIVALAAVYALVAFVWRHAVGQVPFGDDWVLNLIWDKWVLGPLRVLNVFALIVLVVRFRDAFARLPRLRVLETLGKASLPVFCAHLVVALLALALFGEPTPARSWWFDTGSWRPPSPSSMRSPGSARRWIVTRTPCALGSRSARRRGPRAVVGQAARSLPSPTAGRPRPGRTAPSRERPGGR
jgi:hypothetical protein